SPPPLPPLFPYTTLFRSDSMTLPEQGWKLHISATVRSAEEVLLHALPVLLEEGAPFKVASSIRKLMFLNGAEGGMPQIGKFITRSEEHTSELQSLAYLVC